MPPKSKEPKATVQYRLPTRQIDHVFHKAAKEAIDLSEYVERLIERDMAENQPLDPTEQEAA